MNTYKVLTIANIGLSGNEVHIEVDESKGLPKIEIIGLPDAAIKESKERVRSCFKNSGLPLPPRRLIVNLSPSHIRKEGTRFDLPIAVGILHIVCTGLLTDLDDAYFIGELGLDGSVKPVLGLLPSLIAGYRKGVKKFVIPAGNVSEVSCIPGIEIYAVEEFVEIIQHLKGGQQIIPILGDPSTLTIKNKKPDVQLSDIQGLEIPKRALCIAATGMHNVLLVGPPGSGKSYLAKALPGLLPKLKFDQILEVSQMYSLVGLLGTDQPLITQRPYRSVHHTASKVAIVGGGQQLTPGELSLAHLGVLFFDELPEFPSQVLEVLRQPLEDRTITISRVQGSVVYPADVMFVAAMNPCKCGFYKDKEKDCICSLRDIQRYQQKISGPMLDRFDMIVEVPREQIGLLIDGDTTVDGHTALYAQMQEGQRMQSQRFIDSTLSTNSQISAKDFFEIICLTDAGSGFLRTYAEQYNLSARVVHKLCKVGRTIADMEGSKEVDRQHIAEAVYYRGKTLFVGS